MLVASAFSDVDWPTVFTATSAVAAAVAAIAAWATVYVEHRARKRAREPALTISIAQSLDGGPERITVENEGGGVAREVNFLVISGPNVCFGGLPPTGTLGPGKRIVLAAGYPATMEHAPVVAAVICRFGPYMMAWDAAGRHERQHLDRTSGISQHDMLRRFYPDVPPVDALSPYRYELLRELSTV